MKDKIFSDFISQKGRIGKEWGLGEPAGKIWGALLYSNKPLTQKEIAKQTDYSLSLVSPSLKILEKLNMISATLNKKKEKTYQTIESFINSFERLLDNFRTNKIQPLMDLLNSNIDQIKNKGTKKRVNSLLREYSKINSLISNISKKLTR